MKSVFFQADRKLIELSRAAAQKVTAAGKIFWGRMVTGESFITDEGRERIAKTLMPLTVDMETASIAPVCYVNHIPFLSVRCVTDTAAHRGIGNFEANCAKAAGMAKEMTMALLRELGHSRPSIPFGA